MLLVALTDGSDHVKLRWFALGTFDSRIFDDVAIGAFDAAPAVAVESATENALAAGVG